MLPTSKYRNIYFFHIVSTVTGRGVREWRWGFFFGIFADKTAHLILGLLISGLLTTAFLATSIFQVEIDAVKRAVIKRPDIGSSNHPVTVDG